MKTIPFLSIMLGLGLCLPNATAAEYRVKAGETLGGIAVRHHTSVASLRRANGLKGDLIRPGQVLEIPRAASRPVRSECVPSHRVRSGETLWSIARRHGLTVKDLQRLNRLGKSTTIRVGADLALRESVTGSPTGSAGEIPPKGTPGKASESRPVPPPRSGPAGGLLPLPEMGSGPAPDPQGFPDFSGGLASEGRNATTIILKREETVASLAKRHGMTVKEFNELNGWDYPADTPLVAGSELHVFTPARR